MIGIRLPETEPVYNQEQDATTDKLKEARYFNKLDLI